MFNKQTTESGPEEESVPLEDDAPLNPVHEDPSTEFNSDEDHEIEEETDWASLEDSAASTDESVDEDTLENEPKNTVRYEKCHFISKWSG